MFSLICVWTNGWTNNRDAWNLRRHGAHYGITVMLQWTVPGGTLPLESIASGYRLTNDQLHHAKHIRIYSTSQELCTWIALCRVLSWFGSASFFSYHLRSLHTLVTVLLKQRENYHEDVSKWKHFPHNWPFVQGIHRSPVNSLHKGKWRGTLIFSLICVWINGWVNNREAGDLRRHRAHYDATIMYGSEMITDDVSNAVNDIIKSRWYREWHKKLYLIKNIVVAGIKFQRQKW